jgi:hypothetical protein
MLAQIQRGLIPLDDIQKCAVYSKRLTVARRSLMSSGRDPATSGEDCSPKEIVEAVALMERALHVIDANNGPADVGAHLDLAIERLKEWIAAKAR